MSRTKKSVATVQPKTREEMIDAARNELIRFDRTPIDFIPVPSRSFEIGEQVRVGHLKDVYIIEKLHGGKSYLYSCTWSERDKPSVTSYRATHWFNIEKYADTSTVPELFSKWQRHPVINSDIDSLIHEMESGGLVIDPRYQRDYVWSEANKDALLESIFDRLDIGSFLLVRHSGFNHRHDESLRTYRTVDGREVQIKSNEDFTTGIIDGQQRLTTILDFWLGRRPYKGIYFNQMNIADQRAFENTSVVFRLVEENSVSQKDIVRMFLQSNRGVPQAPEHLAKVQALYDSMA